MKVDIDRLFTLAAMSRDKQRERDAISGPCVSAEARAECDVIADKLSAAAASETDQSSVQSASTAPHCSLSLVNDESHGGPLLG